MMHVAGFAAAIWFKNLYSLISLVSGIMYGSDHVHRVWFASIKMDRLLHLLQARTHKRQQGN
jgi:hypothetical protein